MTRVRHLYLHVPFCRTRCPYCDYAVTEVDPPDPAAWAQALRIELDLRRGLGIDLTQVETLQVGGGTPSTLGSGAMSEVRSLLGEQLVSGLAEWTAEVNPEDVDEALLEGWAAAGVSRVHVGVQSLRPEALRWLGRRHAVDQGLQAMERVAAAGLPSWGVDMLFGLPEDVDPDPSYSVRRVIEAGAPHVSIYELVAEEGTPLGERVASGEVRVIDEDRSADQFLQIGALLEDAGYERYELTAFAHPGHRSRHAVGVLENGSWLGVGPGAHSNLEGVRIWNLTDWRIYLISILKGVLPEAASARLELGEEQAERIRRRLRLAGGLPLPWLSPSQQEVALRWTRSGWAAPDPSRVMLTPEGWLRLDELAAELERPK